jgi:hypothetical protein
MAINVTINIADAEDEPSAGGAGLSERIRKLEAAQQEIIQQMGDTVAPFPGEEIDGFYSHFIMSLQFLVGDLKGRTIALTMPPAAQTVSRSAPFIYQRGGNNRVTVPIPPGCTLSNSIAESDFLEKPAGYFEDGKETVWMQILNLDAKMEVPDLGQLRIILGETLKREHPDIFEPSFGVAQSLGRRGFPAKLFFNPYALVETPLGSFRAVHGTLAYGRITAFPPVGTPVTISSAVPLEHVNDVRAAKTQMAAGARSRDVQVAQPFARLVALSHPIDMAMQIPGSEAFHFVEQSITMKA